MQDDGIAMWGELKAYAHVAGYTFEKACTRLETLLTGDGWKLGGRFTDVNAFMDSIRLDDLRASTESRKRIVNRIKELQPVVSNRQIAKTLGVDEGTVRNDTAEKSAPANKKPSPINAENSQPAEKSAPTLSGAEVARIAGTKEKAAVKRQNNSDLKEATEAIVPNGRYSTLVIDPPWDMQKIERDVRPNQVAFDYPTMDEAELVAFGDTVREMLADDAHAFIWTTQKFLPTAFRVLEPWGLRYVLTMTWHKPGGFQPIGLPQYNSEFIIYARAGSPAFVDTKAFNCCNSWSRREHSRKPDEFYDLVRRVTDGPRIDVFSREKRDGFDQFGNEVDKFAGAA